jgi:putative zinc finger/helix-turn-helix YgiT family protein
MTTYCTFCNAPRHMNKKIETRTYTVRGVSVTVPVTILSCGTCDHEVFEKSNEVKNDIAVFDAYKREMNLLTSQEIIDIRNQYGISQGTLAKILGLGEKTITRYENGAIQERAYDNMLRLTRNESIFKTLFVLSRDKLSEQEIKKINRGFEQETEQTVPYSPSWVKDPYDYGHNMNHGGEYCGSNQ